MYKIGALEEMVILLAAAMKEDAYAVSIANEYAEADSDIHLSALCLVGLLLFVVTLIVNVSARTIVWKFGSNQKWIITKSKNIKVIFL